MEANSYAAAARAAKAVAIATAIDNAATTLGVSSLALARGMTADEWAEMRFVTPKHTAPSEATIAAVLRVLSVMESRGNEPVDPFDGLTEDDETARQRGRLTALAHEPVNSYRRMTDRYAEQKRNDRRYGTVR